MSTQNQQLLDAYVAAELAILSGQEFQMGTRSLKRADLQFVQKERARLSLVVAREQSPAGSVGRFSQANFS